MPVTPLGHWSFAFLRMFVDVALAMHFAAAAFWWWLSPKGFPRRSQPILDEFRPAARWDGGCTRRTHCDASRQPPRRGRDGANVLRLPGQRRQLPAA